MGRRVDELGRYSIVYRRVHADEKFRALSWDARSIWLHAYTLPIITQIGCLNLSPDGLRARVRCVEERYREPYQELLASGLIESDEMAQLIVFPKYVSWNPPDSPKQVTSWKVMLAELPECELLLRHITRVYIYLQSRKESFLAAFLECLRNRYPNGCPYRIDDGTPNQYSGFSTQESVDQPPPPDQGSDSVGVGDGGGGGNGIHEPAWPEVEALLKQLSDSMSDTQHPTSVKD